jgi:hypothetical protein
MTNDESRDVPSNRCEGCGQVTPNYDIVHYGSIDSGYRDLCGRCVNADIERRCGVVAGDNYPDVSTTTILTG